MSQKELSMVTLNLSLQIADAWARTAIECSSWGLGGTKYDLSRSAEEQSAEERGYKFDPAHSDMQKRDAERAVRYIELRSKVLPFELHRDTENNSIVWFEDKANS